MSRWFRKSWRPFQSAAEIEREIEQLRHQMVQAASEFRFEEAARHRDRVRNLRELLMQIFEHQPGSTGNDPSSADEPQ